MLILTVHRACKIFCFCCFAFRESCDVPTRADRGGCGIKCWWAANYQARNWVREALVKVQLSSSGSNSSRLDVSTFAEMHCLCWIGRRQLLNSNTTVRAKPMREKERENAGDESCGNGSSITQLHWPIFSLSPSLMEWRRHTHAKGRAECKQTELACEGN